MTPEHAAALPLARAVRVFAAFAFAYFLSALLRAVTATLAPVFSSEIGIGASQLGLLAGAYFLGFAAMQLPLGTALDHWGPRRVVLVLMSLAAIGSAMFAVATTLSGLVAARGLIGVGVSACLMAPLTCYRRLYTPVGQLRANSWMLMTGSFGMVASTAPVQALLPTLGWRGLFWLLAAAIVMAMVMVALVVPKDPGTPRAPTGDVEGYGQIVGHPLFRALAPLGLVGYGGMIAVQALWAGPWLTRVSGWTAQEASTGLMAINLCMLAAFASWGWLMPYLVQRGVRPTQLIKVAYPASILMLFGCAFLGHGASAWHWAAWCVLSTVLAPSQPAIGMAFRLGSVGRALSAYNLLIFAGVFCVQWGVGLAIDALMRSGVAEIDAFRAAVAGQAVASMAAYLWFLKYVRAIPDNASPSSSAS